MGKEHKERKKYKHSKHKHKSKDVEYHVPVVPLKIEMPHKPAAPTPVESKTIQPIGPILPPGISKCKSDTANGLVGEVNNSYGPSLPPHLVQQKRVPGPTLPSHFKVREKTEQIDDGISGFGPLPAELITSDYRQQFIQKRLKLRAGYMKRKFAGEVHEDKQQTAREKWMLELSPEKAANLGLGARQFRKREGPDMSNRSEWTDTPSDKQRKIQETKISEIYDMDALKQVAIQKRDEQMEKLAETSEKPKPYSLLEMHQEKQKLEIPAKVKPIIKEIPKKKLKIKIQSLLDEFDCTEVCSHFRSLNIEYELLGASDETTNNLIQPPPSIQTLYNDEFQNRFHDETAQTNTSDFCLENCLRKVNENQLNLQKKLITDNSQMVNKIQYEITEARFRLKKLESAMRNSRPESSIEVAGASIPLSLTTSESRTDLPHQISTDQGIHNNPIIYKEEKNVAPETTNPSTSNRFLDMSDIADGLTDSVFTPYPFTH